MTGEAIAKGIYCTSCQAPLQNPKCIYCGTIHSDYYEKLYPITSPVSAPENTPHSGPISILSTASTPYPGEVLDPNGSVWHYGKAPIK